MSTAIDLFVQVIYIAIIHLMESCFEVYPKKMQCACMKMETCFFPLFVLLPGGNKQLVNEESSIFHTFHVPYTPCMEYLPRFTQKIAQMRIHIPYTEHL